MKRFLIISVTLIVVALGAKAQSEQHGVLELPLIFDSHQLVTPDSLSATKASQEPYTLNAGDDWLQEAKRRTEPDNRRRFNAIVNHPELVHYSLSSLPEPPKEYAIKGDPTKAKARLGWNPSKTSFEQLVKLMVEHDIAKVAAEGAAAKVRTNLAEYLEKGIVK